MRPNHSTAIHVWPRAGRRKPGPPHQFQVNSPPIRMTLDQQAKLLALGAEYGISGAAVLRKGLELLYEEVYNGPKGFNRNKFIDPCCSE